MMVLLYGKERLTRVGTLDIIKKRPSPITVLTESQKRANSTHKPLFLPPALAHGTGPLKPDGEFWNLPNFTPKAQGRLLARTCDRSQHDVRVGMEVWDAQASAMPVDSDNTARRSNCRLETLDGYTCFKSAIGPICTASRTVSRFGSREFEESACSASACQPFESLTDILLHK